MVGYMSLEEQVDADFTRASRRAFFRRLTASLRNVLASDRLPASMISGKSSAPVGRTRIGRWVVRVEQIVGSVGRWTIRR